MPFLVSFVLTLTPSWQHVAEALVTLRALGASVKLDHQTAIRSPWWAKQPLKNNNATAQN
jgi:hypothetical protein